MLVIYLESVPGQACAASGDCIAVHSLTTIYPTESICVDDSASRRLDERMEGNRVGKALFFWTELTA